MQHVHRYPSTNIMFLMELHFRTNTVSTNELIQFQLIIIINIRNIIILTTLVHKCKHARVDKLYLCIYQQLYCTSTITEILSSFCEQLKTKTKTKIILNMFSITVTITNYTNLCRLWIELKRGFTLWTQRVVVILPILIYKYI